MNWRHRCEPLSEELSKMNYERFLTTTSKGRKPSLLRELVKLKNTGPPELIFLAGGLPNPQLFPFQSASFTLRDGHTLTFDPELMTTCLQYGPTQGYPPLVEQLKALTQSLHSPPPTFDLDLVVTNGSQDGLCKSIEMMVNPGDYVVIQEPCYPGTLAILTPLCPKYLPIKSDHEGMQPESLKEALSRWTPEEVREADRGVPKVMYINPSAANPIGVSVGAERRREIYSIARDYNLIILEDDPYYFVQFGDRKDFPPSFLSLDEDGRVLRFDSFSKVMSSGLRLGYVTGPKPLVSRIILHKQVSNQQASSLSQVLVSQLLSAWGEDGFLKHTRNIQAFYKTQRDAMLKAAKAYLSGLCEWNVPTGGMFLWITVIGVTETWDMVMHRGLEKNVMLVPGRGFMTDPTKPCQFLRASYSLATPEEIDKGIARLAELIRDELKRTNG